ncbi:MAG: hypothetical protein NT171_13090, partial [Planctomycetota bacterium]|nr:hypothetical protein [Planctomycetota bacterium]
AESGIVTAESGQHRKTVTIRRIDRSRCSGFAGHDQPDSAVTFGRNTHLSGWAGSETGSLAHLRRLGNVQGASGVRASGSGGSSQGSGGSGGSGEPSLPSDPVANSAHIPSPHSFRTFQQPQQEPQQATRSGEPSSNDKHRRRSAFLDSVGKPEHLTLQIGNNASSMLEFNPDMMSKEGAAAYTRLRRLHTAAELNRLLDALIVGQGEELGLRALCTEWVKISPEEPLTGSVLVDIGRAVFDAPKFGSLGDLMSLTGLRTSAFSGIPPPTAYYTRALAISRFFDYPGDLYSWPDTASKQAHPAGFKPGFYEWLRSSQIDYLNYLSARSVPSEVPTWSTTQSAQFIETLTARLALVIAWHSHGLTLQTKAMLAPLGSPTWTAASSTVPGLHQLDFAKLYPTIYDDLLQRLPEIVRGFKPSIGEQLVDEIGAQTLPRVFAERTFRNDGLRERLENAVLALQYTAPEALKAYFQSPEFARLATGLATDELELLLSDRRAGFILPWIGKSFRDEAARWAVESLNTPPKDYPQGFNTIFEALEYLLFDSRAESTRATIKEKHKNKELRDQLLVLRIENIVRGSRGPRPDIQAIANTIHDTVLDTLATNGLFAELQPDATTHEMVYLVSLLPNSSREPIRPLMDQIA